MAPDQNEMMTLEDKAEFLLF